MSSRAWVVDLIRSVGQKTAICDHNKEKIEDSLVDANEKEFVQKLDAMILKLRREQQSYLLENAENPNPMYWCQVKHAIDSYTHDVEVYEANPNEKTEYFMKASGEILAGYLSLFLGMEFEVCSRCVADRLLVNEKEYSAKIDK